MFQPENSPHVPLSYGLCDLFGLTIFTFTENAVCIDVPSDDSNAQPPMQRRTGLRLESNALASHSVTERESRSWLVVIWDCHISTVRGFRGRAPTWMFDQA